MDKGKIESFGQKEEMFQHPKTVESARITGCKNLAGAVRESSNQIRIDSWGIQVRTASTLDSNTGHAGIRANHIRLANEQQSENVFEAWVADRTETPFRVTLYLKLHEPSSDVRDFHLLWEMSRDNWEGIQDLPQPLWVHLSPERLFFTER